MAVTRSYGRKNWADSASADAPEISRVPGEGVPAKPVLPLAQKKDRAQTARGLPEVIVKSKPKVEPEAKPETKVVPVSLPVSITAQPLPLKDPGPPDFQESQADSWALDLCIGKRSDGVLKWEPIKVQMELAQDKELLARRQLSSAFTARMIAQLFEWSQNGVILLDVLVKGKPAKAVYDPGCVRIAVSKWYATKVGLVPQEQVAMTVASADSTTTLNQGVFHRLRIKWNETIAHLPAVVLPGVGFNVLLGISWIKLIRVCLDVVKGCLLHEGQEHAYQQLSVPEVLLHPTKIAVYADKRVVVPPGG